MKANRNRGRRELSGAGPQAVASAQGIFGGWGSNLERIQQLFGGGSKDTGSSVDSIPKQRPTKPKAQPPRKPQGRAAPMLDQHEFDHGNSGAFCGIATTAMMLQANGKDAGTSHADLNEYARAMYFPGQGTSGTAMAAYLRKQGLQNSNYRTDGSRTRLVESLQTGQPVPLGVVMVQGEVTRLKGGSSERYPHRKVGDRHHKTFPGSGHWVLVTRFEGRPDKPAAFYVNDPDLGGQLKVTPAELTKMAAGEGQYWMVEQRQ